MVKLDIIIVNYNSTAYLLKCLRSIYTSLGKDIAVKVFVVDNASKDNVNVLQQQFPQVTLSKNKINIGFAKAVNYYMSKTDAPYILLLNPDTLVDKNFFKSILDFMEDNPDVGIAGPKILESNGMVQGSARSFPTPMTALYGRNTVMTKMFPNNRMTSKNILTSRHNGEKKMAVDWVSGACMVVRRSAVKDVGMMDERFFLYWEDADWCKRMSVMGWKVIYYPHASVVHYVGACSNKKIRPLLEFHKSAYYFFCKYSGKSGLSVVKGLVFGALLLRFYVVLISNGIYGLKKNKTDFSSECQSSKYQRDFF
ncbi:MAG: glycosyltransferase family 2 protein [Dissulfuribacterales bacterium]